MDRDTERYKRFLENRNEINSKNINGIDSECKAVCVRECTGHKFI